MNLEKFLATRAYPTAVCRSSGRWCEPCEGTVHPASLMVSAIVLTPDAIATKDKFCCFPEGLPVLLEWADGQPDHVSTIVTILNGDRLERTAPMAKCSGCGFEGPASQDCHKCLSGEMIATLFPAPALPR